MKRLLFALALFASPALAQEPAQPQPSCTKAEDLIRDAAKHKVTVLGQFRDVTTHSGVHTDHLVIFEYPNSAHFLLVGFDGGCMVGFQEVDQAGVDDILDSVTRSAGKPGA